MRIGFLKSFQRSFHWVRAFDEERKHGPHEALKRINQIEQLGPLTYYQEAYKAFLLFHSDQAEAADRIFISLENRLSQPSNPNEEYVRLFCQFYGSRRISTIAAADELWETAHELGCSPMLRRYLQFFRKPSVAYSDPRNADLPS